MMQAFQMMVVVRKYVINIVVFVFKLVELVIEFLTGVVFMVVCAAVEDDDAGVPVADVFAQVAVAFAPAMNLLVELFTE